MNKAQLTKEMFEFADMVAALYEKAGDLRDCFETEAQKRIFNETRSALYELVHKSRQAAYDVQNSQ